MSGVREVLLDRQADVLGLPLVKVGIPPDCTNEVYERRMASTLALEDLRGIDHVAFSGLFLEDVRSYRGWSSFPDPEGPVDCAGVASAEL